MHGVQILRAPGKQHLRRYGVVDVPLHSRHRKDQPPAVFYQRQQMLAQIFGVEAEVVVGIDGDDGVEETVGEWQLMRLGLYRYDLL